MPVDILRLDLRCSIAQRRVVTGHCHWGGGGCAACDGAIGIASRVIPIAGWELPRIRRAHFDLHLPIASTDCAAKCTMRALQTNGPRAVCIATGLINRAKPHPKTRTS